MPGYGAQTWPHLFLPDVTTYFAQSIAGMDRDKVFLSNYTDDIHLQFPTADKFVTLFMPRFPVDPSQVGGGQYTTIFNSVFITRVFVRLESDIEGRDTVWFQDQANGVYSFLLEVIKAGQEYAGPLDASANLHKFRRPMLLNPGFEILPRTGRENTRWNVCPISWELSFNSKLNRPYPT